MLTVASSNGFEPSIYRLGGDCIIRYATRTEYKLLTDYTMIFHNKQKTSL